jgi:hypothetical protein
VELASKNRFFSFSHLDSLRGPEVSDEHKQQKEKLPADDKHKGDSVKTDRHEHVWLPTCCQKQNKNSSQ